MSLSAVVNIMFNKDKNIYLQESIEMDSISCYHNLQKFRSKCLFHGQICDHGHLKSHPVVIFRRTFPHVELSVLTLLIPLSPSDIITLSRGVHHFKIKIFSIGQSESWHNLLADPIPLQSTSDLTWGIPDEDYWLLSIFPFMSKAFEFGMCNFLTENNLLDLY